MNEDKPPVPAAEDEAPVGPSGPDHQTSDTSPDQTIGDATTGPPKLTPASAKALADKVIETSFVPKKVPHVEDIDAQTKAVGGALASALLTATEMPLTMLQPVVADLAAQLVALGIRQTKHVDPEAIHAPHWITDGVRQESIKLPDPPKHTEGEPLTAQTAEAPKCPKRLKAHERAVRLK